MVEFVATSYAVNSVEQWLTALGIIGLFVAAGLLFRWVFQHSIRLLITKANPRLADILIETFGTPLAVITIAWGIREGLKALTLSTATVLRSEWVAQFFWPIFIVWLLFRLYGAFHKEYAVSIIYLIVSRITFTLLFIVAFVYFIRFWIIIQPTLCYPTCVGASLIGRDMSGLELPQANFVEANLRNSDLSRVDLSGADLSATELAGVNLQGANLQNSKLLGASMLQADLRGAKLSNTQLNGANLTGVDLTGANLTQVELSGAIFAQAKLVEVNLADRNLSGVDLSGAILTGADLSGVNLSGASLSGADLSGANLQNANLGGAWLNLTNLTGVDLSQANLSGASLIGSNLASANLRGSNLEGATLIGANLNGADLGTANLTDFRLFEVEQRGADLLLDPTLTELNALQRSQVVRDGNLDGIQFNTETIWPPNKVTVLANILGQDFSNFKVAPSAAPAAMDSTAEFNSGQVTLPPVNPGRVRGDIRIAGSSTVYSLTEAVVEEFIRQGYAGEIDLQSVGTGEGFRLFCRSGETDISMASRTITPDEAAACADLGREPLEFQVGVDALAVVVNPLNNFIIDASLEELKLIFTARTWSEVNPNWPDVPISRIVLGQDTGAFGFFVDEVFNGNAQLLLDSPNTRFVDQTSEVVENIILNPGAVGFLTYAAYQPQADVLKLLSIAGVEPSTDTVGTGQYALARPLLIYSDVRTVRTKSQVAAFITFFLTNAHRFVEAVGYFPTNPADIDASESLLLDLSGRDGEAQ